MAHPHRPPESDDSPRTPADRGVSEILGAILLFGLLVALVVLIQVAAVPGWNQQVEFAHDQRAQNDMAGLADAVSRAGASGTAETVAVELGTTYPVRPFLLNPPPASGALRSAARGPLTIGNAVATEPETADYWSGATRSYDTKAVAYTPDYNEYRNAPTTVLETGALFNEFENPERALVLGGSKPVSGTRISLTTLTGTLNASGVRPQSVDVKPVSAPSQTVAVQGQNGNPITLSLRTTMPLSTWQSYLQDQYTTNGGHVLADSLSVTEGPNAQGVRTVQFRLEGTDDGKRVTYDLRLSRVSVGDSDETTNATYVTRVSGGGYTPQGSRTELVAQARDAYNAPKSGVPITFSAPAGSGSFVSGGTSVTVTTGADGTATATFVPSTTSTDIPVRASSDLSEPTGVVTPEEAADFHVSTVLTAGSGGGGGSGFLNSYAEGVAVTGSELSGNGFSATFHNFGNSSRAWSQVRIAFVGGTTKEVNTVTLRKGTTTYSPALPVRGDFQAISPSVSFPAGQDTTLQFSGDVSGSIQKGSFMVVSVRYENGEYAQYIIGA